MFETSSVSDLYKCISSYPLHCEIYVSINVCITALIGLNRSGKQTTWNLIISVDQYCYYEANLYVVGILLWDISL